MNSLLHTYTGPVLICQGVLDPLNDASTRADMFAAIRSNIAVDKLQLGHCPMDENATMVSMYVCLLVYIYKYSRVYQTRALVSYYVYNNLYLFRCLCIFTGCWKH